MPERIIGNGDPTGGPGSRSAESHPPSTGAESPHSRPAGGDVSGLVRAWQASARLGEDAEQEEQSRTPRAERGDPRPRPGRPRRRPRPGPLVLVGAGLVAAVFAWVSVPILLGGSGHPATVTTDAPRAAQGATATAGAHTGQSPANAGSSGATKGSSPPSDFRQVIIAADGVRMAAWAGQDNALATAFVVDSPAFEREVRIVEGLRDSNTVPSGWSTEVLSVAVVSQSRERAQIRVVDSRSAYRLLSAGSLERPVPAAGRRTWLVDLEKGSSGTWLVADTRSVDGPDH